MSLCRVIPYLIGLGTSAALAALAFAPACSHECSRPEDCGASQTCYQGACARITADYVRCATDQDCGGGRFVCAGARCVSPGTSINPGQENTSTGGQGGPSGPSVQGGAPRSDAGASNNGLGTLEAGTRGDGPIGDSFGDDARSFDAPSIDGFTFPDALSLPDALGLRDAAGPDA